METTKWEYKILRGNWPFAKFEFQLAELGQEGWEAVSMSGWGGVILLKRPLP